MSDYDESRYDVAVSFLARDEPLAHEIAELLAPMHVFVYSKEQEEVAGREGIEAFRGVFREGSELMLVLYREGWGQTPWTQVEETAIRDFCLESGWNRLVFVRLEREQSIPGWLGTR